MKHRRIQLIDFLVIAFSFSMLLLTGNLVAQQAEPGDNRSIDSDKARVVEYWTSERRTSAIPRDLVIDARGLGYLRKPDGSLEPYGHQIVAEDAGNGRNPNMGPPPGSGGGGGGGGGGNDTTPPTIDNLSMNPGQGDQIGATQMFSAKVTDDVGVKSVSFTIQFPDGSTTQTFDANAGANNTWSVTLSGFTNGNWSWWVVAKDTAKRGGNITTSLIVDFTVDTSGSGGPGGNGDTVANKEWTDGGVVQTAAGRLYFEMPKNARWKGPWAAFVCSGTAVTDDTVNGRSIILTAAHCVYDDVNKAFARNVLFIPNQAATTGSGTDQNCNNDPMGCWVPSFGVVDTDWTASTFPDNIPWDYAYYVVKDAGAHFGTSASSDSLEEAAGTLMIDFITTPVTNDGTPDATSPDYTHALGYSLNDDPNLMYCAEYMTTQANNWWLGSCGLSGGSSGGLWVQPMNTGTGSGPIISVNSWSFSGSPGMAGPKLNDPSSAACVFGAAKDPTETPFASVPSGDGNAGTAVVCP